ncbi:fluoride efflux transporter FluC [Jonesia quinghaiensis]|uniref:fluoride efflux transporter FluC n=1 Tax=Jonesia quinghaiensis TaxID=262806 RepID=UPI000402056E|nr:CrcB family protein [Jonesia quinghaiensis]
MILAIAVAGGVGAAVRFIIDGIVATHRPPGALPLGTFLINVVGAFALGLVVNTVGAWAGWENLTLVVGTGLLGGFTTFSTASVEAINIARRGGARSVALAGAHAALMVMCALAAGWVGLTLGGH